MTQNIILGAAILIGLYLVSVVLIRSIFKRQENETDNERFLSFEDHEDEWLQIHRD